MGVSISKANLTLYFRNAMYVLYNTYHRSLCDIKWDHQLFSFVVEEERRWGPP